MGKAPGVIVPQVRPGRPPQGVPLALLCLYRSRFSRIPKPNAL